MSEMKRILVVGGIDKNIPSWIQKSFEIEHYEQQPHFKRTIAPKDRPDLVIALKSWISHKQCSDARTFASENGIPFIVSDGGWSMAIQRAIENGITWFAQTVDKSLKTLSEQESKEVDVIVERAWEGAYKREYEKVQALEKRMRKDRTRLEEALAKLESAERRDAAAARVIAEVREAARKHKESEERIQAEIKKLMNYVDSILADHEKSVSDYSVLISELRKRFQKV